MDMVTKTSIDPGEGLEPMDFFTAGQTTFVVDGPLARAYGEALDVLYKKEIGADGLTLENMALETLELDKSEARQHWREAYQCQMLFRNADLAFAGMVYGVRRQDIRFATLIDIADGLGHMSPQQKLNSAVILDKTRPTGEVEDRAAIATAIEHYCSAHKVPVYATLAQFLRRCS